MNTYGWYSQLKKPTWAPPPWIFGPVWSVLYLLIGVSFIYVFLLFTTHRLPLTTALPFVLNLVFNLAFTPIQFGLRNSYLAAADILLVLITLAWSMIAVWPVAPWVAIINVPYLAWVMFATTLQLTIVFMNRKRQYRRSA